MTLMDVRRDQEAEQERLCPEATRVDWNRNDDAGQETLYAGTTHVGPDGIQPGSESTEAIDGSGVKDGSTVKATALQVHVLSNWLSWKLSWWFALILSILNVGLISTIVILDQVSLREDGFVTVPTVTDTTTLTKLLNAHKYYGLLWTSLPSFLFTIFGLLWTAVVSGASDRQPFVELKRGGPIRKTLLLDYRIYPSLYSWFIALRNHHTHIGLGMTLALVFPAVAVPLSARLLYTQTVFPATPTTLNPASSFNLSAITSQINLQPFINIADAIHAYGSEPPPWMTTEYAFSRYSLPFQIGNISFATTAYSSLLDCQSIPPSSYSANISSHDGTNSVSFSFVDRSCPITILTGTIPSSTLYTKLWYQRSCFPDSRIGLIAGLYSPVSTTHLDQLTILSCIPTYWSTIGTLRLGLGASSTPKFVSFTGTNDTEIRPQLQVLFENPLQWYSIFDPSSSSVSNAVGFATYSTSLATNNGSTSSAMSSSSIQSAFENIYATTFAAMARSVLLQDLDSSDESNATGSTLPEVTATLTSSETRLLVTRPIAYTLIAILLMMLACNLLLCVYTYQHHTPMLAGEPVGLIGSAALLQHSPDVFRLIDQVLLRNRQSQSSRNRAGHDGAEDPSEAVKKSCGRWGRGEFVKWTESDIDNDDNERAEEDDQQAVSYNGPVLTRGTIRVAGIENLTV